MKNRYIEDIFLHRKEGLITFQCKHKTVEKPLLKAESRFPISNHPELFCCFSPDFKYTFVNDAYCRFFNKKREELIGTSIFSFVQEQYHYETSRVLQSLSMHNPVIYAEYTWIDPNGRTNWRQWTGRAVFDETGYLIEYQSIGQDITERKRAEEQIRYRLKLEEAVASASRNLINPGEADIAEILRILGEAVSSNRTYIWWIREDGVTCDNIYEWCDLATEPMINNLQNLDVNLFPWSMDKLQKGEDVIVEDINDLPPIANMEKEGFKSQGICSLLMVPIKFTNGELRGYMGFDDTEKCRQWKNEDIRCIRMVAGMLGGYWERTEFEKALRDSEAKFRTLAETVPALIYVWSQSEGNGSLAYINSGYKSIIGYNCYEELAMKWLDFVHPDYQMFAQERIKARMLGDCDSIRYEVKFLNKNAEEHWGDISASPIQWEGKPAVLGILYDITEHKRMEEELLRARIELEARVEKRTEELSIVNKKLQQEISAHQQAQQELMLNEARYRAIVENQSEMVVRALPDMTLTFVNEALARFFNKRPEYFMGNSLLASIVEEDKSGVMEKLESLTPQNTDTVDTVRLRKKGGMVCWHEWTSRAIFKGQNIVEYQAVGRDVTERKMAEEALKRSEANFRKLAETSPALIYVLCQERFLYMNSKLKAITGCNDEDMANFNAFDLIHPDYREKMRQAVIAQRNREIIPSSETKLIGRNGQEICGYLTADIIDYEGQEAVLGIIIDITEQKKMEEDLLKATKLESLGILAGGIAHDFNNILTVISGNISLAKMITNPDNEINDILNEVEKAAFQARDLTQQLLTFSKGGAPIKETASIQELLRDSASFVLRGSNVNCKFNIAEKLWAVNIDKGQISQVINNLIINANQAMPEGGSIEMSAVNFLTPANYLSLAPGNYVKISIKDQGIGIPEKHMAKVFDPYFTTKQKGHGLGLATCYSIIKKHAGDITIHSELGIGTTIDFYLPASPNELLVKKDFFPRNVSGQGKILIMDDEIIVRDTLGRMLKHLGYNTDFASDGQEAIVRFLKAKQTGETYDAVILDLTIAGGMGGKEACNKLLQIDSQVKILVSSGYSNDPVMADYKKHGFCGVIPKPYEINGLNQVLYEAIANEQNIS